MFNRISKLVSNVATKPLSQRLVTTPVRCIFNRKQSSQLMATTPFLKNIQYTQLRHTANEVKVGSEGTIIFMDNTCTMFRRFYKIFVFGAAVVGCVGIGLYSMHQFPTFEIVVGTALVSSFFLGAAYATSVARKKVIAKIMLRPDNTVALYPMALEGFEPPTIVPVNEIVPFFADNRGSHLGIQIKVIKNRDVFNGMKIETKYYLGLSDNNVVGRPRDAFDHLCGSNTTFRRK